jgi:DNA-binding MarR family transcriptional regulator
MASNIVGTTSETTSAPALSGTGTDVIDAIVTELQAAIRGMRCGSTERLVRRNLSTTQVHVLWLLEHQGAMPMSRLAELLDVSLSAATGLMDRMEEHGLIERSRVPDDRRVVLVRPAAGGRLALEENEIVQREQMRSILGRLGDEQLARAFAAFRDIRSAIEAESGSTGRHHHHFVDSAD